MRTVYVNLLFDFCFFFDMVVMRSLSTGSYDSSGMLPTSKTAAERVFRLSAVPSLSNKYKAKYRPSEVSSKNLSQRHGRLAFLGTIASDLHKKSSKAPKQDNDLIYPESFKWKREPREDVLLRKNRSLSSDPQDFSKWTGSKDDIDSGIFRSPFHFDHRQLVKRDSSLITEDCGPIGNRCSYVSVGQCLPICINGRRKRICKIQGERNSGICFTIPYRVN